MVKTVYFDHRHVHMTSWHMLRDSIKMMSHMPKCVSIPSNRYDEAIFAVGIIKKVTGEKRQGGGTHRPGRPRVKESWNFIHTVFLTTELFDFGSTCYVLFGILFGIRYSIFYSATSHPFDIDAGSWVMNFPIRCFNLPPTDCLRIVYVRA